MIASARRSRSCRSGSATEVWCRTCSCFIGRLHPFIVEEIPENGETTLLLHLPLQLLHLCPNHQVNRFVGCDCHIEQGFKITKRGGWQWQRTRMTDPQRAARLWLAVAVATLWLLSVGGMAEETIPESTLLPLATDDSPASRSRRATQLRLVSIFRRGWITILMALINQQRLPRGRFIPESWPQPERDNTQRGAPELRLAA
jgi:hypothetical protein